MDIYCIPTFNVIHVCITLIVHLQPRDPDIKASSYSKHTVHMSHFVVVIEIVTD